MSSLEMINAFYESEPDDEDDDLYKKPMCIEENLKNTSRLPLPKDALATVKDPFHVSDDTHNHQGKIRSFKHERGNWATFVCIPYDELQLDELCFHISQLLSSCQIVFRSDVDWHPSNDVHLSLSRTVAIPHHFIDPLVESLQSELVKFCKFTVTFATADLRFYVNDEKTRSFLGFEISSLELKSILKKLVNKVDDVLHDYRCDKFYEEGSYHLSIAWCLGDITTHQNCEKMLNYFQKNWTKLEETADYLFSFEATEVLLKCGNRTYNFQLR